MRKQVFLKKAVAFCLAACTLVLILLSFASCDCVEIDDSKFTLVPQTLTKEELEKNVRENRKERESVTYHLYEWGFPEFNVNRVQSVEALVEKNYYEQMPSKLLHATLCAESFLEYFYDNIDLRDTTAVTYAILHCYLGTLGDPYAVYREPALQEDFREQLSGGTSFVGIGVQIRNTEEELPYICAVYEGSGAEAAGIRFGDILLCAGGVSAKEQGYRKTVDALKGEAGTYVDVVVSRGGEEIALTVERKQLVEVSVYSRYDEQTGYGYVRIMSFQYSTGQEFKKAIDALEEKGAVGYIFDVRDNLGGVINSVIEVVSYLVEDDLPCVTSYNKNGVLKEYRTLADNHSVNVPMVVITNSYTASAAEIFAAALRDYSRSEALPTAIKDVTIVGERTYGKGIMQSSYGLSDKSSVTFTSAYYDPPSGVNYHGIGVAPDEGYEVLPKFTVNGDAQLDRAYAAMDEYFTANAA